MVRASVPDHLLEIGRRITAARESAGMSVNGFAKRLGVGQSAVYALEQGKSVEKFLKLATVAAAIGSGPNALLGVKDGTSPEALRTALTPFLTLYGLTPEQVELISRCVSEAFQQSMAAQGQPDPLDDFAARAEMLARMLIWEGKIGPGS